MAQFKHSKIVKKLVVHSRKNKNKNGTYKTQLLSGVPSMTSFSDSSELLINCWILYCASSPELIADKLFDPNVATHLLCLGLSFFSLVNKIKQLIPYSSNFKMCYFINQTNIVNKIMKLKIMFNDWFYLTLKELTNILDCI